MSLRKTQLLNNEFYHIYNRGVDKREIFLDKNDIFHFLDGLKEFNRLEPIGSLYENSFRKNKGLSLGSPASKLVEIVAYCINPNHFHLILKQNSDKGVEKFMQKLGTSYTKYFNNKNKRSGSLLQGRFKSKHIDNNEYLLYLSAYVNLNNKIHNIPENKLSLSSIKEYRENINGICNKEIIIDQYKNNDEYVVTINNLLPELNRQKLEKKEIECEFGELL
jgi:putative transposase